MGRYRSNKKTYSKPAPQDDQKPRHKQRKPVHKFTDLFVDKDENTKPSDFSDIFESFTKNYEKAARRNESLTKQPLGVTFSNSSLGSAGHVSINDTFDKFAKQCLYPQGAEGAQAGGSSSIQGASSSTSGTGTGTSFDISGMLFKSIAQDSGLADKTGGEQDGRTGGGTWNTGIFKFEEDAGRTRENKEKKYQAFGGARRKVNRYTRQNKNTDEQNTDITCSPDRTEATQATIRALTPTESIHQAGTRRKNTNKEQMENEASRTKYRRKVKVAEHKENTLTPRTKKSSKYNTKKISSSAKRTKKVAVAAKKIKKRLNGQRLRKIELSKSIQSPNLSIQSPHPLSPGDDDFVPENKLKEVARKYGPKKKNRKITSDGKLAQKNYPSQNPSGILKENNKNMENNGVENNKVQNNAVKKYISDKFDTENSKIDDKIDSYRFESNKKMDTVAPSPMISRIFGTLCSGTTGLKDFSPHFSDISPYSLKNEKETGKNRKETSKKRKETPQDSPSFETRGLNPGFVNVNSRNKKETRIKKGMPQDSPGFHSDSPGFDRLNPDKLKVARDICTSTPSENSRNQVRKGSHWSLKPSPSLEYAVSPVPRQESMAIENSSVFESPEGLLSQNKLDKLEIQNSPCLKSPKKSHGTDNKSHGTGYSSHGTGFKSSSASQYETCRESNEIRSDSESSGSFYNTSKILTKGPFKGARIPAFKLRSEGDSSISPVAESDQVASVNKNEGQCNLKEPYPKANLKSCERDRISPVEGDNFSPVAESGQNYGGSRTGDCPLFSSPNLPSKARYRSTQKTPDLFENSTDISDNSNFTSKDLVDEKSIVLKRKTLQKPPKLFKGIGQNEEPIKSSAKSSVNIENTSNSNFTFSRQSPVVTRHKAKQNESIKSSIQSSVDMEENSSNLSSLLCLSRPSPILTRKNTRQLPKAKNYSIDLFEESTKEREIEGEEENMDEEEERSMEEEEEEMEEEEESMEGEEEESMEEEEEEERSMEEKGEIKEEKVIEESVEEEEEIEEKKLSLVSENSEVSEQSAVSEKSSELGQSAVSEKSVVSENSEVSEQSAELGSEYSLTDSLSLTEKSLSGLHIRKLRRSERLAQKSHSSSANSSASESSSSASENLHSRTNLTMENFSHLSPCIEQNGEQEVGSPENAEQAVLLGKSPQNNEQSPNLIQNNGQNLEHILESESPKIHTDFKTRWSHVQKIKTYSNSGKGRSEGADLSPLLEEESTPEQKIVQNSKLRKSKSLVGEKYMRKSGKGGSEGADLSPLLEEENSKSLVNEEYIEKTSGNERNEGANLSLLLEEELGSLASFTLTPAKPGKGWRRMYKSMIPQGAIGPNTANLYKKTSLRLSAIPIDIGLLERALDQNREKRQSSLQITYLNCDISIPEPPNPREQVLRLCSQVEPVPLSDCFTESRLACCKKIGEGVYGEVFMTKPSVSLQDATVLKIMPIEGDFDVNGEPQKKFEEILSEIVISMELSNLRNPEHKNWTENYVHLINCWCVQGSYCQDLLSMWDQYSEEKGSENDRPDLFPDTQLYVVLEFGHGGGDLESYVFNNSRDAYSVFLQVAYSLAVSEQELEFEHRDLHWGNVLVAPTKQTNIEYKINGEEYILKTHGLKAVIIDFTLSRMKTGNCVVYNDLAKDPSLFTAEGDYQFEIYREMKKANGNEWEKFTAYTNVLWLDYLLDKMLTQCYFKNTNTKIHKKHLSIIKETREQLLSYQSATHFVQEYFDT